MLPDKPRAERERSSFNCGTEAVGADPAPFGHLVGGRVWLTDGRRSKDGTNLVLDDSRGINGAITKIGQHAVDVGDRHTELLFRPAHDGVIDGFVRAGVTAERVRPDSWPGQFGQCTSSHENITVSVGHVTRKGEMEWRLTRVDGRFGRRANWRPILGNEDDQFFDGAHKTTGYPESVLCQKTLMCVAKR